MSSNMRTWTLHGLPELVSELGGDVGLILQQFNISRRQLESDDATLPSPTFIRLLEFCARELKCPDFGLRLGFRLGPEALGPIVLMAKHCETAGEAALAISSYLHAYIPALTLQLAPLNQSARRLQFTVATTGVGSTRQFLEWSMGVSLRNLKLLAGDSATPYAIHFSHPALLPLNSYKRFFGSPVYFGEEFTSLDIRKSDLNKSLAQNDPQLRQVLADYIEKTAISSDASLEEQIRTTTKILLPTGRCKLKVIADQYSMSLRTLQRRLSSEGLNFNEIVDDIRKELLAVYLQERNLPLTQVAALLGYGEQSSLTHACQRWYGRSPAQLRVEL
ncbi:AraC family transcriptional regulator [Zhongshania sp.]|uniref:AraC family transcriptional regulator n=1 Tax=Zhongshania sp. TaxID=1971902 RepID=UPI0035657D40